MGARRLLLVSVPAALLASIVGVLLGTAAGYWGDTGLRLRQAAVIALLTCFTGLLVSEPTAVGWWLLTAALATVVIYSLNCFAATVAVPLDWLVQSTMAWLGAVPRLVLVLALTALHAPTDWWLTGMLALLCWTNTARLTRTLVQQLCHRPYVEAGRTAGLSSARLLWHHILPNAWPSLRTSLPLNLNTCLALQTTLAFLGIGLAPDQADWGATLANARLEPSAWWLVVSALLALTLTVVALYLLLPPSLTKLTVSSRLTSPPTLRHKY
ncbi:ABC transporter permease subunit [Hymenobacter jeollabukensis]